MARKIKGNADDISAMRPDPIGYRDMSQNSSVSHAANYPFLQVRLEYLLITDRKFAAAMLLDLFEFYSNSRIAVEGDGVVSKSLRDLSEDLFGIYSPGSIRAGLQLLAERGYLDVAPQSDSQGQTANAYRFNARAVTKAVLSLPEAASRRAAIRAAKLDRNPLQKMETPPPKIVGAPLQKLEGHKEEEIQRRSFLSENSTLVPSAPVSKPKRTPRPIPFPYTERDENELALGLKELWVACPGELKALGSFGRTERLSIMQAAKSHPIQAVLTGIGRLFKAGKFRGAKSWALLPYLIAREFPHEYVAPPEPPPTTETLFSQSLPAAIIETSPEFTEALTLESAAIALDFPDWSPDEIDRVARMQVAERLRGAQ